MTEALKTPTISVSLGTRTVRVFESGNLVKSSPCAIGMKGFRTPPGHWELGQRSRTPDWRAPAWAAALGMVPGKVYKFGEPTNPYSGGLITLVGIGQRTKGKTGYALHGSKNKESIRNRVAGSHGCVRVPDWFIKWIYERCPEGTPVRITKK